MTQALKRFFNTEGPVQSDLHYMIPPLERIDLAHIDWLIRARKYFIVHAPRQTGKTSCLQALVELINQRGEYSALYVNLESAQHCREDFACANNIIADKIGQASEAQLGDTYPQRRVGELAAIAKGTLVNRLLADWSVHHPKPIVLMLDEVDSLVGDSLGSLLRQLRDGHADRPKRFPQSVILCGVRDVHDYRIESSKGPPLTSGSPFNIRAESLRLGDFSRADLEALYAQHTAETGQVFEPAALELAWRLTLGQPWLVNALAFETTHNADPRRPITADMIEAAKESLILRRVVHIDQLAHKLREERVRRIVGQIVAGGDLLDFQQEDVMYCLDLGLVRRGDQGLEVANPIYREVIPRYLTMEAEERFQSKARREWYVRADNTLDVPALMVAFQQFFRENSEHWLERFDYKEAGPQLLLQAFLQRIVNGGGRIEREYGLGRRRTDLLVIWPHPAGVQRVVFEIKATVGRPTPSALEKALEQTADYMDRCGAAEGHLVWFDRGAASWDDKIEHRVLQHGSRAIHHWGA